LTKKRKTWIKLIAAGLIPYIYYLTKFGNELWQVLMGVGLYLTVWVAVFGLIDKVKNLIKYVKEYVKEKKKYDAKKRYK